ncbi:hypothetical protein DFP72DRAFT_1051733 [Ephemerocybe angulata]|uniref:Uncharacterized protein n=1 Tax=Ephemerocybe angulata TaxID=980116 RepID=A0A8H6HEK5_9AGAR|nr:hypothetical protein DFP72DRAFT_1051733 [Tulosesus angulatus]
MYKGQPGWWEWFASRNRIPVPSISPRHPAYYDYRSASGLLSYVAIPSAAPLLGISASLEERGLILRSGISTGGEWERGGFCSSLGVLFWGRDDGVRRRGLLNGNRRDGVTYLSDRYPHSVKHTHSLRPDLAFGIHPQSQSHQHTSRLSIVTSFVFRALAQLSPLNTGPALDPNLQAVRVPLFTSWILDRRDGRLRCALDISGDIKRNGESLSCVHRWVSFIEIHVYLADDERPENSGVYQPPPGDLGPIVTEQGLSYSVHEAVERKGKLYIAAGVTPYEAPAALDPRVDFMRRHWDILPS